SGQALLREQGWLNGLVYAPNAHADPDRPRSDLPHAADLARVGLAGTLRDYRMTASDGRERPLAEIDYKGQPAGYASSPDEVVNYVENHDNQTVFDINVFKLPRDTSAHDRARVQVLGMAHTALSQGLAYFHAGVELLRPVRADASIEPRPLDIVFARVALLDLLRIRASTRLLRMRDADEVQRRLRFLDTGPDQSPVVLVGHLDGSGLPGERFGELLYFINAGVEAQALELPELRGRRYALHPVHLSDQAADPRPRESATYEPERGRFVVPARTALVYVVE